MSLTKVVRSTGEELEIPRDVEAQGPEAVDAYVATHLPPEPEVAPVVAAEPTEVSE